MPIEAGLEAASHTKSVPEATLINMLRDESKSQPRDDVMAGIQDSLSYSDVKGHLIRDGGTALIGLRLGLDVYSPFSRKIPYLLAWAVGLTTLSRKFEDDTGKEHSAAYEVGRFGADVFSALGAGLLTSRATYDATSRAELNSLIDRDWRSRYVPAYRKSYGPKQYSFRSHTEYTGLTLEEKERDLTTFLKTRKEMNRFPNLYDEMAERHKPELERKVRTSLDRNWQRGT